MGFPWAFAFILGIEVHSICIVMHSIVKNDVQISNTGQLGHLVSPSVNAAY
jgi:hypothetical protein